MQEVVVDMGDNLYNLVYPRPRARTRVDSCPAWQPRHRAPLRSAVVGGQWPQMRLAQAKWTDETQCQLCLMAPGTLEHRHVCTATRPAEGWPAIPAACLGMWLRLSAERQTLLQTRGLFALRVRVPQGPCRETFAWHLTPAEHMDLEDAEWYIDGSMFEGLRGIGRSCGMGIVVVSREGQLLCYGSGIPPAWVHDAAGAELWAFYVVLRECAQVPKIFTDCHGILDGLGMTPHR